MDIQQAKLQITSTQGGLVAPPTYTQVDTNHGVAEIVWINRKPDRKTVRLPKLVDAQADKLSIEYVEFEARDYANRIWVSERVEIEVKPDGTATIVDYGHNVVYRSRIWGTAAELEAMGG